MEEGRNETQNRRDISWRVIMMGLKGFVNKREDLVLDPLLIYAVYVKTRKSTAASATASKDICASTKLICARQNSATTFGCHYSFRAMYGQASE